MRAQGPELVLGVDAGNSKTVAVVADVTGRVLGWGRAGNGDIYGAAAESAAVRAVTAAADAAMTMAYGSADHTRLSHSAWCLAGLDWPSDHQFWSDQLDRHYPGLPRRLHNDGFALLRAGEPTGIGVAVSAGTGGAVVARGPEREWTASFWIVDSLGGFALGHGAYAAVVRSSLGIAPSTMLTRVLLDHFGYADTAAMLEDGTKRQGRRLGYASLARCVLDAAAHGDEVARQLVDEQASALASYAVAAVRQVGLEHERSGFAVVMGGSVLSSQNPILRDATVARIADLLPRARTVLAPVSPVVGAVAEAIAESQGRLMPAVVTALGGYRFPPAFLLT